MRVLDAQSPTDPQSPRWVSLTVEAVIRFLKVPLTLPTPLFSYRSESPFRDLPLFSDAAVECGGHGKHFVPETGILF